MRKKKLSNAEAEILFMVVGDLLLIKLFFWLAPLLKG